ncbi:hypothetical protein TIFTF001_009741 [Ficus carica]|uniref:Uncharacterized protein n=1 Tax=Ficus carica TaxID=3494 RepID=A0AA87ZQG9_FICCA|nr:hypothetical protein TIFTF001_009741 [Ficus carica]
MFNMNGKKKSDHQLPQKKPLQIQQDDKFFSRLLSRENSIAHPSSRLLYYGRRPGSVPFLWESEPGTPKSKSHGDDDNSIVLRPPLTPPPSYYFNSHKNNAINKRPRASNLLNTLFPKKINNFSLNKKTPNYNINTSPNSFWSSSENSSMLVSLTGSDSSSAAAAGFRGRSGASRFSSSSSSTSFDWRGDHEENHHEVGSPNSTLCFGCYRL